MNHRLPSLGFVLAVAASASCIGVTEAPAFDHIVVAIDTSFDFLFVGEACT